MEGKITLLLLIILMISFYIIAYGNPFKKFHKLVGKKGLGNSFSMKNAHLFKRRD